LIAQFPGLPADGQIKLLKEKWDLVRGPEMVPALLSVIAKAAPKTLPDDANLLEVWGVDMGLAESALERLNEVSTEEAARLLWSDIASGKPRFAGFPVRTFPAQDISEDDEALLNLLPANSRGALPLVARFASVQLADEMRKLYRQAVSPAVFNFFTASEGVVAQGLLSPCLVVQVLHLPSKCRMGALRVRCGECLRHREPAGSGGAGFLRV
jgi:hypothetical protein